MERKVVKYYSLQAVCEFQRITLLETLQLNYVNFIWTFSRLSTGILSCQAAMSKHIYWRCTEIQAQHPKRNFRRIPQVWRFYNLIVRNSNKANTKWTRATHGQQTIKSWASPVTQFRRNSPCLYISTDLVSNLICVTIKWDLGTKNSGCLGVWTNEILPPFSISVLISWSREKQQ